MKYYDQEGWQSCTPVIHLQEIMICLSFPLFEYYYFFARSEEKNRRKAFYWISHSFTMLQRYHFIQSSPCFMTCLDLHDQLFPYPLTASGRTNSMYFDYNIEKIFCMFVDQQSRYIYKRETCAIFWQWANAAYSVDVSLSCRCKHILN